MDNLDNAPYLLTVREVAFVFHVSPLTIKRWDKKKKLVSIRINERGDRRFKRTDAEKLLKLLNQNKYGK